MKRPVLEILAENVLYFRLSAGMSKADFCTDAAISRPTLDRIEHGEANVRLDKLEHMARVLRIEPSYLLKPLDEIEDEFWDATGWR